MNATWWRVSLFSLVASLLVTLFLTGKALGAEKNLQVHLFASHAPQSSLALNGPIQVRQPVPIMLPGGKYDVKIRAGLIELFKQGDANQSNPIRGRVLVLSSPRRTGLSVRYGQSERHYPGRVSISVSTQAQNSGLFNSSSRIGHALSSSPHLVLTNQVSTVDYVTGVCASEMPEVAPLEALKAQVVLINSELARYGTHTALDDTTQRQSYIGVPIDRPLVGQAVQEVGEQCLLFKNVPIKPYYHSTCAGGTSNAFDIFDLSKESYPYLRAVKCEHCKRSPFFHDHEGRIIASDFASKFGQELPQIEGKDDAGRPLSVSYTVRGRKVRESGYAFWIKLGQRFGWDKAPGNLFDLKRNQSYVLITSRGAGHGVGMCQWGAIGMAQQGKDYKQILAHYFSGTFVSGNRSRP